MSKEEGMEGFDTNSSPDAGVTAATSDSGQVEREEKRGAGEKLHRERLLSAYVEKPKHVHFETQERSEKINLLLRRHFITNLGWMLVAIFLILFPLILLVIPVPAFIPFRYLLFFLIFWFLFVVAYVFENILSWYYNVYIITDERIVDVDFHSLLYKEVSQAKIDQIQDITFVMVGIAHSLFNYGTVYIQTAGEKREFDFEEVPYPDRVAKILNELILEEEREKYEGRVQ